MQNKQFYTALIVLITILCPTIISAQASKTIEKTDCFLLDCSDVKEASNIEFGYLTVPENYDQPNKKQLKIAFAIIKSKVNSPEPDPVLIFQGGWGTASLDKLSGYAKNFPIKNRDVILFDYRGTGYSQPKLCDWIGPQAWEDLKMDLTHQQFQNNQTARFNRCLDSLQLKDIDYNQYGSNTKTKDALLLAQALGYEAYNLFGISYGTRAILNFIRNAKGTGLTIRSAILDSNSPIGVMHQGRMTETYTAVLNNILDDCEQDPSCNQKFPNLKNRFTQFLESLDTNPWIIPLNDGTTFYLNKEELNATLHQVLYKRTYYQNLPIFLEHLIARDNNVFQIFLAQPEEMVKRGYNALGAVNFVYDHKYFRDSSSVRYRQRLAENSPYEVLDGYMDFYMIDRRIATDSLEHIPVKSDIPALFLAGTYDPITPVAWTQFTAQGFPNSFYIEAKKFGHGIGPTPCGSALMSSFYDNPKEYPENSCLENFTKSSIPFRTQYYKNSKIGILLKELQSFNLVLIIALIFIAIVSLVNTIKFFTNLFKYKAARKLGLRFSSFLILAFLIAFVYVVFNTVTTDSFLSLFGLLTQANYVFYLTILIVLSVVLEFIFWLRKDAKSRWDFITLASFLCFIAFVSSYNLWPNF